MQTAQQFGQVNVSKADRNRMSGLTCVHEQVAKRIVNVRFTISKSSQNHTLSFRAFDLKESWFDSGIKRQKRIPGGHRYVSSK